MTAAVLGSSRLGTAERETALARMAQEEFDVVIVGAGIVGAGVALDAATRGLSVAVVESHDFASGTSSRSSKLIHGGLRYLEQYNFELVREALTERGLLLHSVAPHLVRPVPFLFPLTHRVWERGYVGAGVALYDTLAFSMGSVRGVPHHRHLTRSKALRLAPSLRRDAFVGAVQYWDAQVDDARYVMTVLRTAAAYGAQIASRTQCVGFLREGERVTGLLIRDLETGVEAQVRAK
jgi:glycerol-3-phosphate dehydrogenase